MSPQDITTLGILVVSFCIAGSLAVLCASVAHYRQAKKRAQIGDREYLARLHDDLDRLEATGQFGEWVALMRDLFPLDPRPTRRTYRP